MNFEFSEIQRDIRDAARSFTRGQIAPHSMSWDEKGALPTELITELGELGFLGLLADESVGGAELDAGVFVLVLDEVARASASAALMLSMHNAVAVGAAEAASHRPWAAELCRGERLGVYVSRGDDGVKGVDDGASISLTGGFVCRVSGDLPLLVAMPRTPQNLAEPEAYLWAVPSGASEVERIDEVPLGLRAAAPHQFQLENVTVHLADAGAWRKAETYFQLGLAAVQCGVGEGALNAAIEYAKERKQFGRPIASFQAIQWMIADARSALDAARLLTLRAAADPTPAHVAMACHRSNLAARSTSDSALQIHGGYGYTADFPVERAVRDSTAIATLSGSPDHARRSLAPQIIG